MWREYGRSSVCNDILVDIDEGFEKMRRENKEVRKTRVMCESCGKMFKYAGALGQNDKDYHREKVKILNVDGVWYATFDI